MKTTFLKAFRSYIRYHQKTNIKQDQRTQETINSYKNKYLHVSRFLASQNLSLLACSDFKARIARQYLDHLSGSYVHNYAVRCMAICSTVLDFAVNEEMADYNPLGSFSIQKTPPKPPTRFSPAQIMLWERYLSPKAGMQKAADLFTLIFHTGFDYGDLDEIGRHLVIIQDGFKYIIKGRHKNGNEAIIPLVPQAERILEKYNYRMKLMANKTFNQRVKAIAAELGINIYLTIKSGRKIFVMDRLNHLRYSIEAVSKMAGHKSIKTTEQVYGQVTFDLVHNEVLQLSNINQNQNQYEKENDYVGGVRRSFGELRDRPQITNRQSYRKLHSPTRTNQHLTHQ